MKEVEANLNELQEKAFVSSKKVCKKYLQALGGVLEQDQSKEKSILEDLTVKIYSI